jgi:hypothetical protein
MITVSGAVHLIRTYRSRRRGCSHKRSRSLALPSLTPLLSTFRKRRIPLILFLNNHSVAQSLVRWVFIVRNASSIMRYPGLDPKSFAFTRQSHFATMRDRWCTRRRLQALGAFTLLLISAQLLYTLVRRDGYPRFHRPPPTDSSSDAQPPPPDRWKSAPEPKFHDPCKGYTSDPSIITVVKTGATEASRRLPPAMISYLSCAIAQNDVLVFSDLDQHLGALHIHDSLDTNTARENNTEFKLYYDQKRYLEEGQEIGVLASRSSEAWALDKYKNIHTAQKAWELKPGKSWYFFIDADTYVVWPSLFALLKQYNPSTPYYIGTASESHRVPWGFAHGGSGYALSRAAMQLLVGSNATAIAKEFDTRAREECCGDIVFSWTMADVGVNLTNAHPMINGDWANNYRFGPHETKGLWCKPLVTMHHVNEVEMGDFWAFERRRENPKVRQYRQRCHGAIPP